MDSIPSREITVGDSVFPQKLHGQITIFVRIIAVLNFFLVHLKEDWIRELRLRLVTSFLFTLITFLFQLLLNWLYERLRQTISCCWLLGARLYVVYFGQKWPFYSLSQLVRLLNIMFVWSIFSNLVGPREQDVLPREKEHVSSISRRGNEGEGSWAQHCSQCWTKKVSAWATLATPKFGENTANRGELISQGIGRARAAVVCRPFLLDKMTLRW